MARKLKLKSSYGSLWIANLNINKYQFCGKTSVLVIHIPVKYIYTFCEMYLLCGFVLVF